MSTSKLLGAICTGALLLSAGCTTNNQTLHHSAGGEAVTATERFPYAVLDERVGQVLAVTFAFDHDTLDRKARALLDAQADWMAARPELHFSVNGHADKVGNPDYNLDLGLRRAERVVDYLVEAGIERDRLEALVSHGEYEPVVQTERPERLNRRVVIEVAGVVEKATTRDATPWWRHTPRPYLPNVADGPDSDSLSRSWSDTSLAGSPETTNAGSNAPTLESDKDSETKVAFRRQTEVSDSNTGAVGDTAGSGAAGESTRNQGSNNSGPTPTNTEQGSTASSSQTSSDDGNSEGEASSSQAEGSSSSKNKSGSQNSGKSKGSKGSSGNPSKSNPSSDRVDAGGGNGPEAGGDPGQSDGRNQGGDDD